MADADDDRSFLASTSAHPDRPGDTSNMNPAFVTPLATAIRQARAEGINAGVGSGFRTEKQTGSTFDASGNSAHTYGLASDISGIGARGSSTWQRWNQIAQANGLNNPYLGTAAEGPEFNHWQLPPQPLNRMNPSILASLKAARATGDNQAVWNAYSTPALGTTVNASNAPIPGALARPGTPTPGSSIGDYYHTTMMHESGGQNIPNSAGGWGAAGGYYQFTPSTYANIRSTHPELNLPENIQDANQDQQTSAMKALTQGNVDALTKAGIPINDKNAYMAHFLGPGGATNFINQLSKNPGATAADLFPNEAKSNPGVFNNKDGSARTMQQVFDAQTANQGGGNTTGFGPNVAPSDTTPAAATPPANQSLWDKLVSPPTDSSGNPVVGGKSPLQQATSALTNTKDKGSSLDQFKKDQEEQAPELQVRNQAGQAPGARNVSPGLASIPQTYGQTINSFSRPLSWTDAPPQAPNLVPAGLQRSAAPQMPGISLNSFQGPPGYGVGYGVDPNIGYGVG